MNIIIQICNFQKGNIAILETFYLCGRQLLDP